MPLEMSPFFQEFNFDTLLALISCITGIIALFLGGSAYKQCQINKNSFNEKKNLKTKAKTTLKKQEEI